MGLGRRTGPEPQKRKHIGSAAPQSAAAPRVQWSTLKEVRRHSGATPDRHRKVEDGARTTNQAKAVPLKAHPHPASWPRGRPSAGTPRGRQIPQLDLKGQRRKDSQSLRACPRLGPERAGNQRTLGTRDRHHGVPSTIRDHVGKNSGCLRLAGRGEKIHEKVCRYGGRVPIREVWRARAMTAAVRRVLGLSETLGTCASSASNETRRS